MVLLVLSGRKTQENPQPPASKAQSQPLEMSVMTPSLSRTRGLGQALQVKMGRQTPEHPRLIPIRRLLSVAVHVEPAVLPLLIGLVMHLL